MPGRIAATALVLALLLAVSSTARTAPPAPEVGGATVNVAQSVEAAPPQSPHFVDRFGQLEEEARWAISDGWSNGDWVSSDWRREQVQLSPEGLAIIMARNPPAAEKPYSSGEISTHETYQHGYFEARLRMPRGPGLVVGVFTYTRPEGEDSWNEIDMELLGRDTRTLELTYHVAGEAKKQEVRLPFDAAEGFHTYAFEWRPDAIIWYVDNVVVHEARGDAIERMDRNQRFYVSLWNSTELFRWVGRINPAQAPWRLDVSCVAQAAVYSGRSLCADAVPG